MNMRLIAVFTLAIVSAFLAGPSHADGHDDSSALMLRAAHEFLASLNAEQREACLFPFDRALWESWHFIPMRQRSGLPLDKMTPEQIHLADILISSGTSRSGYQKTKTIMSHEKILFDLETASGGTPFTELRNPNGYYFAFYGTPSETDAWGWRVEGHHISLHFGMNKGRIITSTPMFFGANPHEVPEGPRKGLRPLGREEDLGRALLESLTSDQRAMAIISEKAPSDVLTRNASEVAWDSVPQEGLPRAKMTDAQKGLLQALINEYVYNVPRDLAARRLQMIDESADDISFVWMGSTTRGPGNPNYHRVHGKTFLIEYDNTQNQANHSHTVWRDYKNDFGRDALADHYRAAHRSD